MINQKAMVAASVKNYAFSGIPDFINKMIK